ncbi:putative Acyl-CoA Delta desaturase [Daphnia magna]|uniref:Putative Acyl-CoA Delta desaturase n=1 Tax=Daphnia magna TaxID=35525 RepID=A0A164VN02_9CRUS|nr:putative Acyl-CoA Delta desaturase [Daphnia magna]
MQFIIKTARQLFLGRIISGTTMSVKSVTTIPDKTENTTSYSSLDSILWCNVLLIVAAHIAGVYGFYLGIAAAKWQTVVWTAFLIVFAGFGITAGAHRLWSHRSYRAKWPLRLLVAVGQTMALQHHIYHWVLNHRMHHKYSETDADPFNVQRGFFFSHVGWTLCEEHPEVTRRRKAIVMTDIQEDPIVVYQQKLYVPLAFVLGVVVPVMIPGYFWGECQRTSFFMSFALRFVVTSNVTWMINSVSHILPGSTWGSRPYDRAIGSTENRLVAVLAIGEGWHNYHHVFPWDYKAAEFGDYSANWTTALIDWFADIGWVTDRKTVPERVLCNRVRRTGDGSHPVSSNEIL